MKILITGGGTCEPIDTVRYITNFSTGRTAAFLADFFCKKGADVTALMAENAQKPKDARIITYRTFSDLQKLLESECKNSNYGAIIHAAAVSDYSVQEICVDGKIFPGGAISKIPSGKEILLKMQENPKLLYKIKQWSGNSTKLVAFKLTSGASEEEQQMLAMGRALMSHPKLLMLDEPSMGLAPLLVEQIFDIIRQLHADGTTILLVEQNAQAALAVADRGYVLETGRIITEGTGTALLESDTIRKAYLGG